MRSCKKTISRLRKSVPTAIAVVAAVMLLGCAEAEEPQPTQQRGLTQVPRAEYLWVAYWDQDGAEEALRSLREEIPGVCLFGGLFDQEGRPFVHEATRQLAARLENDRPQELYLTFVNDMLLEEGSSLKDVDLLYSLLSPQNARQHAQELLDLTAELGCDGVEIDYERIRSDLTLWVYFEHFLSALVEDARSRGLSVRVLLETSAPVEELYLPAGPEYVVMCYNLHCQGTAPGPKADPAFLREIVEKFARIPQMGYALANGGYLWEGEDQFVRALTTQEAQALAEEMNAELRRDPYSWAMTYSYMENGSSYTVWYGDAETLAFWEKTLEDAAADAVDISIWRLDG